ncbi:flap endonuclease-1 [Candidatus Micrarchaeota archaeon CG_4_10_14_0_2_um_filter_60_11]|nr:MAG: flap endonuclease-1 [Candidatus Micrarchaeota archaeon CG1_02_60_51]PIN96582.1 MAG: flap endonuclease-1 [Candidatus Micrarchaeota archaeon CG10_big_fil_rev_8_21_14_0_10_60_32]PIO02193.1 MAG: flap endonuclease-1 [Candidatus Micrarchaeota archaeon CG09_land_8_20_14_0_10_60_16]PIY91600.1 MAG: flap endonuclease-1 [Candidatus Micrarchaeota archaeon CG_4_10_14_0_8_um_filter_60_7]PIZ90662.1 MAG: flap endonuclease-1 [Candidatus Micrarchaeota archaeon CG_4_10_14_0_2_um_filter_60_11]
MGARDLKDITVSHQVTLEELRGRVAVDAYNAVYQFLSTIRGPDGAPLADSHGRTTSHLSGLFYRSCSLLEKGVQPIYVFDGKPSELKARTIAERVEKKMEAEELMKKALEEGRIEEAARLAQRTSHLTKDMVAECKTLLGLMGLPFVQAPSEGESQCAAMAAQGCVGAAASQDFDALLFGAPVLIRNLTLSGKRKLPRSSATVEVYPEKYFLKENLDALGLTRQQLVWVSLLCGTDFNEGVKGIGPKKGLKLVRETETLEGVCEKTGQDYASFKEVETLFLNPRISRVGALEFGEPDRDGVIAFMAGERDFSEERVSNALARAFNQPLDASQGTLKRWF